MKNFNKNFGIRAIWVTVWIAVLSACGAGSSDSSNNSDSSSSNSNGSNSSNSSGGSGSGSSLPAPQIVNRLASDVALADTLSGGFAEGISADPDTGDLYVGTDNNSGRLTGFILKAGSQQNSFSDWALTSAVNSQGRLVTGTRVRSGVLYACTNFLGSTSQFVLALKLSDKSVLARMRLPSNRFCNDLAFDDAGNLFVTGNEPQVIYKLAAANVPTAPGVTSFDWQTWHTTTGSLNGLTYNKPTGKLLWSQDSTIQSSATTAQTASANTEITLPDGWGVDGLQLTSAGNLLAIVSLAVPPYTNLGAQRIQLATGTKGSTSAVTGGANCATTIAIVGDDAYCTTTTDSGNQPIQKVLRLAGAGKL